MVNAWERRKAVRSSQAFNAYCRKKGIKLGENVFFPEPATVVIDFTRPCLIEIGDNVRISRNMTLLTHDFATRVFLHKYGEFVNSSGRIKIGNNVWFGHHCTVLKGATIGDNCIIGFGSTVMGDIPPGSVAAGTPAKVICSLDDYLAKRKAKAPEEALDYARAIVEREHRLPVPDDFREEFPYFVDSSNMHLYPGLPIKFQLGVAYDKWLATHKAPYTSFAEFLSAAGIDTTTCQIKKS